MSLSQVANAGLIGVPRVIGEARGQRGATLTERNRSKCAVAARVSGIMDGELVEIVSQFGKLRERATALESRLGHLPLRRIQAELALLSAELLEEIDRCTDGQAVMRSVSLGSECIGADNLVGASRLLAG